MLLIGHQIVLKTEAFLEGVADGIQAAVARRVGDLLLSLAVGMYLGGDAAVLLLEVHLGNLVGRPHLLEFLLEELEDLLGHQLLVLVIGLVLGRVAHGLAHLRRQVEAEVVLQNVADAALSGLAVDTDHVRVVVAAYVRRVNRQIGHIPVIRIVLHPVMHTLGDGVLMGAGEGCEYKRSRVGASLVHLHAREFLIGLADLRHIAEIQLRIHALGIHIHGQGHHVHVAGALSISKEGSLYAVGSCQQAHLGVRHAAAAVVVGMQGDDDVVAVFQVLAHVLNLAGVYVGHGMLDRHRKVDDRLFIRRGLPHVEHRVADLQGVLRLRAGEALRAVFKAVIAAALLGQFFQKLRSLHGDLQDLLLRLMEYLLSLGHRGGIVHMHDGLLHALQGLEGLADDMLPGLGQHLNRHIVGDQILLNQGADKGVLRLGRCREAYLDLLKSHLAQKLEEANLLLQGHGNHQRLVAVAKIYAAPHGRFVHVILLGPFQAGIRR